MRFALRSTRSCFSFSKTQISSSIRSLILSIIIKVTFFIGRFFPDICFVEFDIALEWFEKLADLDPYHYENMDMYYKV